MINFHSAKYVISCPDYSFRPKDNLSEVVFVGRSNVGKSTLINSLTGQRLAYSSKKAGKTRYLNYFLIDSKFYLVDSPGYGYTSYGSKEDESFGFMMESYFKNPFLKGACLLFDARRSFSADDRLMLSFVKKTKIPFFIVFTKCDEAKQADLSEKRKQMESLPGIKALYAYKGRSPEEIRAAVLALLH